MLKKLCKICQMFHLLVVELISIFLQKKMPDCLNVSDKCRLILSIGFILYLNLYLCIFQNYYCRSFVKI